MFFQYILFTRLSFLTSPFHPSLHLSLLLILSLVSHLYVALLTYKWLVWVRLQRRGGIFDSQQLPSLLWSVQMGVHLRPSAFSHTHSYTHIWVESTHKDVRTHKHINIKYTHVNIQMLKKAYKSYLYLSHYVAFFFLFMCLCRSWVPFHRFTQCCVRLRLNGLVELSIFWYFENERYSNFLLMLHTVMPLENGGTPSHNNHNIHNNNSKVLLE